MSKDQIEEMIKEAEKYKEEDEAKKECIDSKNSLENYLYSTRSTVDKPEVTIPEQDKQIILQQITEKIKWLDDNQTATKDEFDSVLKEVQDIVNPILTKIQQDDEPTPANQETQEQPIPTTTNKAPIIEEVD
jgi:L1 cell adhesion molecule like protein